MFSRSSIWLEGSVGIFIVRHWMLQNSFFFCSWNYSTEGRSSVLLKKCSAMLAVLASFCRKHHVCTASRCMYNIYILYSMYKNSWMLTVVPSLGLFSGMAQEARLCFIPCGWLNLSSSISRWVSMGSLLACFSAARDVASQRLWVRQAASWVKYQK